MKKKKMMLILVLLLAIGFASVSTTLIITGVVGVGINREDFVKGVVFDEESLTSSTGTTAEISESGRIITFVTQEMKSVDETATVNFKIKNYSQYDAVLGTPAISCYFVEEHQVDTVDETTPKVTTNEYMQLIPGNELNGKTITAGGGLSAESRVTVKQIKSYVGNPISIKFQCVINATGGESETPGIEKPTLTTPLAYYAFGDPTTASTTDYTTLGKEVFVKLENNQKSVCIVRNNELECFRSDNFDVEKEHVQQVFSDVICEVTSESVTCEDPHPDTYPYHAFECSVGVGSVYCDNGLSEELYCQINLDGTDVECDVSGQ